MAKIKYYYDTETCKYERVRSTTGDIVLNILGIFCITLGLAFGMLMLYISYFESPKELMQRNEIVEMEYYYENLKREVDKLNVILADMEHRDDNIYRVVLGAEPIESSIREAGVGGMDRYAEIKDKSVIHEDLIINLHESVDKLRRKVYIESKSHDEIVQLAENKAKLYAAIPAIQPIANKELIAVASGFGMRIHPIYKVKKLHPGIDFAAVIGLDRVAISLFGR